MMNFISIAETQVSSIPLKKKLVVSANTPLPPISASNNKITFFNNKSLLLVLTYNFNLDSIKLLYIFFQQDQDLTSNLANYIFNLYIFLYIFFK